MSITFIICKSWPWQSADEPDYELGKHKLVIMCLNGSVIGENFIGGAKADRAGGRLMVGCH